MIQKERVKWINRKKIRTGEYILYWMQASQRAEYNHALEYSIVQANEMNKPLVVFFGITDKFPEANLRHYSFMLEGLGEVQKSLQGKGIKMVVRHTSPERGVLELAKRACLVVTDRGYLRVQREWRHHVAQRLSCPLIQVETDVIIPVEEASPKEEYSAATFRPKVRSKLGDYLVPLRHHRPKKSSSGMRLESLDLSDPGQVLSSLKIDQSVDAVRGFRGGTRQAKRQLEGFIRNKLGRFEVLRNDPTQDFLSNMSPYLHFGQISPSYVALQVMRSRGRGKEAYLEELVVRRELSVNFVFYNQNYDSFSAIPDWSKKTLHQHRSDRREYVYSLRDLENSQTHDPYWNAAQQEMRITGKMHGYMRMYWGKKILEWTKKPEEGYRIALYLNNKYELDGRDPNGFTGVAWCFGKHDRPWGEREIFGKVRYMNASGLKRKFDADGYVRKIDDLNKLKS